MKHIRQLLLSLVLVLVASGAKAQITTYSLDSANNGSVINFTGNIYITDDGGSAGIYSDPQSYTITIAKNDPCHECGSEEMYRFALVFEAFDIDPLDTLFIYDGLSTSAPLLKMCNNSLNNMSDKLLFVSPNNNDQAFTLYFKVRYHANSHQGFVIRTTCEIPCEKAIPFINDTFYRATDGVPTKLQSWTQVPLYDSIDGQRVQVGSFPSIDLCAGSGAILYGHGEYTHNYGYYDLNDKNVEFRWHFGNFYRDSVVGMGATKITVEDTIFRDPMCYDVELTIDTKIPGCPIQTADRVKVRVAKKPLTRYGTNLKVRTICTGDSILLSPNADDAFSIFFDTIAGVSTTSKINDVRTFIPDGPNCETPCYMAPVTFTEFPVGRTITDAADICSICINFEHEYMGDYRLAIVCPNGSRSVLKYGNPQHDHSTPPDCPDYVAFGDGTLAGFPYGGSHVNYDANDVRVNIEHSNFDGDEGEYCDSIYNPYGDGLNYCWSRNHDYTLVTGDAADVPTHFQPGEWYLGSYKTGTRTVAYVDTVIHTFQNIPVQFVKAGETAGTLKFPTKHPSDYENKLDYYSPASDFSELIGCPLNGEWNVEVCDYWKQDNGWVFSWSMDICGVSYESDCDYVVNVDTVRFHPDSTYGDTTMGYYRGLQAHMVDSMSAWLSSPDTAGSFPLLITLIDDFGCQWDTSTTISTVWTPEPHLPEELHLCSSDIATLDANDAHSRYAALVEGDAAKKIDYKYSFIWEPNGQTSDTIQTERHLQASRKYIVEVTNTGFENTRCVTRDTTLMIVNPQPQPNFDANVYPFEGCEPFTLNIQNNTKYATQHKWVFGDGSVSYLENPSHTYAAGTYDFKYYAVSDSGCIDSLIYTNLVSVYPHPVANFNWNPVHPSVLNPSIQLQNLSYPQLPSNTYYWEFQYDKDNPYSFHTQTEANPSFTWVSDDGRDLTGEYLIRLIARTDNQAPSGQTVQCADTIENTVLLVNDFLQFPNVVTPNGDGINDILEIKNLIEGLAYPNNQLDIYNRWGSCVYHVENISRREDFWDPAATNSPTGTYFYKFTGVGYNGPIERTGAIEVLR